MFQDVPAGLFDQLIRLNVLSNVLLHVLRRFLKELQTTEPNICSQLFDRTRPLNAPPPSAERRHGGKPVKPAGYSCQS